MRRSCDGLEEGEATGSAIELGAQAVDDLVGADSCAGSSGLRAM